MAHLSVATSNENAEQTLVRSKSVDMSGVSDRRRLGAQALKPTQTLKPSQALNVPTQTFASNVSCPSHLAVPRPRAAANSRSNSSSSANGVTSRQLNSVSSLSAMPEATSTAMLKTVVEDIDAQDHDNPQLCAVYVKDVYKYLRHMEEKLAVRPTYMTLTNGAKAEISPRMRSILIDWLTQVHNRFALLQETLYLTVDILDRFLQEKIQTVGRKRLQLVGITAMWIASKYEEIYAPAISDFVYITDNAYDSAEIRKMELDILRTIDYNLGRPLALHFLRRNSKAGEVDSVQHALAKYFLEVTLQEYSFAHVKPSEVAAAALWLSLNLTGALQTLEWPNKLAYYSGFDEEAVTATGIQVAKLVVKLPTAKTNYVLTKYQSSKFMKISSSEYATGSAIQKIADLIKDS